MLGTVIAYLVLVIYPEANRTSWSAALSKHTATMTFFGVYLVMVLLGAPLLLALGIAFLVAIAGNRNKGSTGPQP